MTNEIKDQTTTAIETSAKEEVTKVVKKIKINNPELTEEQKHLKAVAEQKLKISEMERKQKEDDLRMVTGTFKNFQSPGIPTVFSTRKYKSEPIRTWKFRDGEIVTIPYYVAKMLRQECYYKRNKRYQGSDGKEDIMIGECVKLMDFYPHTEFIPGLENDKKIVHVEMRK